MTTLQSQIDMPTRGLPVPVTSELALAFPRASGCRTDVADEEDEDWAEFLSLGTRVDLADPTAGGGWRHAPVLLSY